MSYKFFKPTLLLATILLSYSSVTFAQNSKIGCINKDVRFQSENLKMGFTKQGMVTYQDAMIKLENRQPFFVAVELQQGNVYQMLVVGNKDATKLTFELFDGDHKLLATKEIKKGDEGNTILYSFIPPKNDIYLVAITERNKKDNCGSFTIMMNVPKKEEATSPQK